MTIALRQHYFRIPTLKQTFLLVKANDPGRFPGVYLSTVSCTVEPVDPSAWRDDPGHQPASRHRTPVLFSRQRSGSGLSSNLPSMGWTPARGRRLFWKEQQKLVFGFKLHVVVNTEGLIVNTILTSGNWHDRDAATTLIQPPATGSVCLGDRIYHHAPLQYDIWESDGVVLLTRAEAGPTHQALLCSIRCRVETTFSQLWARVSSRLFSRSWAGLWTSLLLNILDHSLVTANLIPAFST